MAGYYALNIDLNLTIWPTLAMGTQLKVNKKNMESDDMNNQTERDEDEAQQNCKLKHKHKRCLCL